MSITPSIIISPKTVDRMTITDDNQIQLWRCSDYFKSRDGIIVVHYKNSLIFNQSIDRVQINEFKLTFRQKQGNLKVYPIARTEKLTSSINTQIYHENLLMIQNRIDQLTDSGNKIVHHLKKKMEKYCNNYEFMSAQAINLPEFNNEGFLFDESKQNSRPIMKRNLTEKAKLVGTSAKDLTMQYQEDDLVPFN